jgi:NAD(P)-dependent dehydrogenase (short-subunit alcohol dehydrogenase family)
MGIGAATAQVLCELGASVAILDRDEDAAQTTVEALTQAGCRASFFVCDVSNEISVKDAIDAATQKYGGINVLVSNAGIQRYGDVTHTSSAVWDETFNVHVKGCFHVTRFGIPVMLASGGGSIVVVGSVQSLAAVGNSAVYIAAKHALLGLTRSIALDYADQNIRANCVCPGTIDTPMLRWSANLSPAPEELINRCARMHPLGRIGSPREVARAIAFLASDWASFITGTSLLVDGGLLLPAGGMGMQRSGNGISGGDE